MKDVTITDNILYIGADDRDLDLFESQYVIPNGVSYNSYVILDEKVAVMDTVDTRRTEQWLKNLEKALNGRTVDYLVVSHMEPDHAANVQILAEKYPDMKGYYPHPKPVCVSEILSYQNLSGVYSPFTIEANYNGDMQDYNIPFTACHELSHLRGFMQEQEANFIAFLACSGSEEEAFAYSGYLMGWILCMNVLYRADYDAWEEVRSQLPQEAEQDLKLNREFWAEYDGRIAEVSNRVNDTYLKANGQSDGVKSYNRMVDLIVAYYERDGR